MEECLKISFNIINPFSLLSEFSQTLRPNDFLMEWDLILVESESNHLVHHPSEDGEE